MPSSTSPQSVSTPRPRPHWFPMDNVGGPNTWTTINNHLNGIQKGNSTAGDDVDEADADASQEEDDTPRIIEVRIYVTIIMKNRC